MITSCLHLSYDYIMPTPQLWLHHTYTSAMITSYLHLSYDYIMPTPQLWLHHTYTSADGGRLGGSTGQIFQGYFETAYPSVGHTSELVSIRGTSREVLQNQFPVATQWADGSVRHRMNWALHKHTDCFNLCVCVSVLVYPDLYIQHFI